MGSKQGSAVGVFISYSHEDRLNAETIAKHLREGGYQPWVDFVGIEGGDDWKKSIENALSQSVAFIVLLTPEAVSSKWVRYEITQAQKYACRIIPLMIRPTKLPADIASLQSVDFFRQESDAAFKKLDRALVSALVSSRDTEPEGAQPPRITSSPAKQETRTRSESSEAASGPAVTPKDHSPLALVVEDIGNIQALLRDLLTDMGLEVHIAGTRNEATDLIHKNTYDFITLDMQLGPDDESGQEGVYLLDLLERYQPDVPVVMITHLPWDKHKTRDFFRKYHIKDMLDKPFDQKELRALVREHVTSLKR